MYRYEEKGIVIAQASYEPVVSMRGLESTIIEHYLRYSFMQSTMDISADSSVLGVGVIYVLGIADFMQQSRRYLLLCKSCIAAVLMRVFICVATVHSMESMLVCALGIGNFSI